MRKILFPAVIFMASLLSSCNSCNVKPVADEGAKAQDSTTTVVADTTQKKTTSEAAAFTTCHSTDTVDFTFTNASDITYCVDQVNGTISILNSGTCMQTLQNGETHRWTVVTKSGTKHFRDYPSSPSFNASYPTIYNPFDGVACDLGLSSTAGSSCGYILIGTDDIRNDATDACEEYRYRMFNSNSTATFYVDIKIDTYTLGGVTKYRAAIKQSNQTSTSKPTSCSGACDQNVCKGTGTTSTPCP